MAATEMYSLAGCELESPLLNAAGAINGTNPDRLLQKAEVLGETGIGGFTFGSFTVPAQQGNEATYGVRTYHHDPVTGETHNSEGLPNVGKEVAVNMAPEIVRRAHERGKVVIYSGAPTNMPGGPDSIEQACQLAYDFLQTAVDLVEINVSCQNVVTEDGGRKPMLGHDFDAMHKLFERLTGAVGRGQRLGLKLPPYLSDEERTMVPGLARLLRTQRVFRFIVTCNTIPGQVARDKTGTPLLSVPNGEGGKSGPATKTVGREQLSMWAGHLGNHLDIVSALGVDSGQEIGVRLDLGAAAASGVTVFWESHRWGATVSTMLSQYVESVSEQGMD